MNNEMVFEFDEVCGKWTVESRVSYEIEEGDKGDRMTPPHDASVVFDRVVEILSVLGEHGEVELNGSETYRATEWIVREIQNNERHYEECVFEKWADEDIAASEREN
jgi:hypothetical protein